MSVKVHEPVCEDSAQDLYFWFDHFLGDQLKDEWDVTIGGAGSAVVVDAQTGGIVRLTTGVLTNNATLLDWNDIRSLLVTKKVTMEVRARSNHAIHTNPTFRLTFDAANEIQFLAPVGGGGGTWDISSEDGGGSTVFDTGITLDTDWHIFRIACHTHGASHVHFYYDGAEVTNSPITTNIPDDAADVLQPFLRIQTFEDAAKSMDIDYCVVRQDR